MGLASQPRILLKNPAAIFKRYPAFKEFLQSGMGAHGTKTFHLPGAGKVVRTLEGGAPSDGSLGKSERCIYSQACHDMPEDVHYAFEFTDTECVTHSVPFPLVRRGQSASASADLCARLSTT